MNTTTQRQGRVNYTRILIQIFSLFLSLLSGFSYSQNHPNASPSADAKSKDKKEIAPLPRHILLPKVTYGRVSDIEGEYTLDFTTHKVWLITLVASWNEKSGDIARILNSHAKEFKEKDIGVLSLFSQNTVHEVDLWRLKNKPLFDNFFASRNFIDSLKNPKIPVIWLVGKKREILLKVEMPTIQQIDATIEKSFILTSF